MTVLLRVWLAGLLASATPVAERVIQAAEIPEEDYLLYDQVVERKFLSSRTVMVLLERMTLTRLLPGQAEPLTVGFFNEQNYFTGRLPPDLVHDFVSVNRTASRLEGRFRFGVRYRFVEAGVAGEPEVEAAWPVRPLREEVAQAPAVLDRLAFSRVGRTPRNDQALLYVEHMRVDGTGAGFLIWFRREGRNWAIFDTDVVWVVRVDEGEEESP